MKNNREKDYAEAAVKGQHMQLGFLKHALMISRFHFMLELACKSSAGEIQLEQWRQGSELAGHKVELPMVTAARQEGCSTTITSSCRWSRTPCLPCASLPGRLSSSSSISSTKPTEAPW